MLTHRSMFSVFHFYKDLIWLFFLSCSFSAVAAIATAPECSINQRYRNQYNIGVRALSWNLKPVQVNPRLQSFQIRMLLWSTHLIHRKCYSRSEALIPKLIKRYNFSEASYACFFFFKHPPDWLSLFIEILASGLTCTAMFDRSDILV